MEMCYNDCKLNRTDSKPKTRCHFCQLLVHNACLDEPKKSIISGAWTCRDCRKIPVNTTILLDLVTELCDKMANLESIIFSLQKQNIVSTSVSTQTDATLTPGIHMCIQTDPIQPIDLDDVTRSVPSKPETTITLPDENISLSKPKTTITPPDENIPMVAENTSATASYLRELLDDLEEDVDGPASSIIDSPESRLTIEPAPKKFEHVFIGNTLVDTTAEEVRSFLLNIGLTEITSVERVGRYHYDHAAFHVTLPVHQNLDIVYNYEWRDGIIVEPFRMSARRSNH